MFTSATRILVVDDMATMRRIVRNSLKNLGFEDFIDASNGRAGWEAIEQAREQGKPIDLVICDWNMPELNGIDLLKKIRADARYGTLPFLMLTAESERAQVERAELAGCSSYITKPFSPTELKDHLARVFEDIQHGHSSTNAMPQ